MQEGAIAFHTAAQRGHLSIVQYLLKVAGPDIAKEVDSVRDTRPPPLFFLQRRVLVSLHVMSICLRRPRSSRVPWVTHAPDIWLQLHNASAISSSKVVWYTTQGSTHEHTLQSDECTEKLRAAQMRAGDDGAHWLQNLNFCWPLLLQAGNSAVHLAAANGKKEMVQWLLENVMNDAFKSKNEVRCHCAFSLALLLRILSDKEHPYTLSCAR